MASRSHPKNPYHPKCPRRTIDDLNLCERGGSSMESMPHLTIGALLIAAPLLLAAALYVAPVASLMLIGLTLIYAGIAVFVWSGSLWRLLAPVAGTAIAPSLIAFGVTLLVFGGMVAGVTRAVRSKFCPPLIRMLARPMMAALDRSAMHGLRAKVWEAG